MRKILFVAINARYVHSNLALLYLRKITEGRADSVIAEYNISQSSYDILADIFTHDPRVVAISVYIWNVRLVKELVNDIKKVLPEAKIVLGGPEVSYSAEQWLSSYPAIDYVICEGGERGWQELLDYEFAYPEKMIRLSNFHFREVTFPYTIQDFNALENRIVYYESSRNCPFECTYCLSSRQEHSLELRNIEQVQQELDFFIEHEVPLVKFIDRTFNANADFARFIWSYLTKKRARTRFHFEINPLLLTEKDIELLQKVPDNSFQFEIGIQSTNRETLEEIRRPGFWEQIKDNIAALIHQTSIPVHLDLIFGLPYETFDLAQRSFNDIYRQKADRFQPGMLKVLPGTVMEQKAKEYCLVYQKEAPYKILGNCWISFSELQHLQKIEHMVNNLYNSHRFRKTLEILESLFPSPFELYSQLVGFWEKKDIRHWQKDWDRTATLLAQYVGQEHNSNYELLIDSLRWDLCAHSGLQYYPDFLITEELRDVIAKWKSYIKKNRDEICRKYGIGRHQLQRSLIFSASSKAFREKMEIKDDDCLLFITTEKKVKEIVRFNFGDL